MDVLRFIVGGVLPYLAVAVFVGGMIHRIMVWRKLPSPPITLFPAPPDERSNTINTFKEALFFRGLFRSDRALWVSAWGFHVVLALIAIGHLRVVADVDGLFMRMGLSESGIEAMSAGVGGAAGILVLIAAVALLARRFFIRRVKEVTEVPDILALLLIGTILVTGNMMRFGAEHFDLALTREYFASLATFGGAGGAEVLGNNVFLTHLALGLALVMIIPFSKILHFGGIFFTHQLIRKH